MRRHGQHVDIVFHRRDQECGLLVYMRATQNSQGCVLKMKRLYNFIMSIYVDLYIEDTSQNNILGVRVFSILVCSDLSVIYAYIFRVVFLVPALIARFMGANMGPIWVRQDPGGPHVDPMNFAIWEGITTYVTLLNTELDLTNPLGTQNIITMTS